MTKRMSREREIEMLCRMYFVDRKVAELMSPIPLYEVTFEEKNFYNPLNSLSL